MRLERVLQILQRVAFGFERIDWPARVSAELEKIDQVALADKFVGPAMDTQAAGLHVVGGFAVVEGLMLQVADVAEAVPLAPSWVL